jgi:hypothetical protein
VSTDRDVTRIVRSWLDEGVTALPDRVLDLVLDQVPATPQRHAPWLARRFPLVNNVLKVATAAVAIVVIAILGISLLPRAGVGGPTATATPSQTTQQTPSASPGPTQQTPSLGPGQLAVGSFISHGGQIELDATGSGANVVGTMSYADVGGADNGGFVVDLKCTRTTAAGLILIGGPIIESSKGYATVAPLGSNIALILQPGSPVNAEIFVEHPDPHEPSCPVFLESIAGERPSGALEPIDGTIALRP